MRTVSRLSCTIAAASSLLVPQVLSAGDGLVPEFLGVYIATGGQLIELESFRHLGFGGDGLFSHEAIPGPILPDGQDFYFVVYKEGAASQVSLVVAPVLPVRYEVESDRGRAVVKELENLWVLRNRGVRVSLAPLAKNPAMMVKAVPRGRIGPGIHAFWDGEAAYFFKVAGTQNDDCLLRDSSNVFSVLTTLGTQETLVDCAEFFSKNPNLRPRGGRRTSTLAGTSEGTAGTGGSALEEPAASACPPNGPLLMANALESIRIERVPQMGNLMTVVKNLNHVESLGVVENGFCKAKIGAFGIGWVPLDKLRPRPRLKPAD